MGHQREKYTIIGPRPSQVDHAIWRQTYCIVFGGARCPASRLHRSIWLQKPFSLGVTGVSVLRDSAELPLRICTLQMVRRLSLKTLTHPQGLCSVELATHISLMVTSTLCYDSGFVDLPVADSLSVTLQRFNPVVMVCTESQCRSFFSHVNRLSRS